MKVNCVLIVVVGILSGCMSQRQVPQSDKLLGSWKADAVSTEDGTVVMELIFQNTSEFELKISPAGGRNPIVAKGQYHLNGDCLVSDALNKGQPVLIWFEKGYLFLQTPPEKPQRFLRENN